jgi:hypothetical protein
MNRALDAEGDKLYLQAICWSLFMLAIGEPWLIALIGSAILLVALYRDAKDNSLV